MVRHRAFLPGFLALVVALVLTARTAPRTELAPPFHGIARADRGTLAELREAWSRDIEGDRTWEEGAPRRLEVFRRRVTALGEPASRALLEILVEHFSDASFDSWRSADQDEEAEIEGVLIGELATDATGQVLARAVKDRGLATGLRRSLVVALCRPRFAFAAEALAGVAGDRRDDPRIREAILGRFQRLGCPVPASMRDLLYQPYDGLDVLAAATLAICGDAEAPSLILDGLTVPRSGYDEETLRLCAEAVHRITHRPLTFSHSYTVTGAGREAEEASSHARVEPHIAALKEWMAEHPAETEYERRRRDYLEGDARRREMAIRNVEDVVAAGEDFDFAAASLWLTAASPEEVGDDLEKLHRLAFLCRQRLAGVEDRAARIDVLNDLLAQFPLCEHHDPRWGSRLPGVLRGDYGNCVGRSTLYLAVAERLGLPLRPYVLPAHVYVTWEEEGFRRNIETTDGGRERPGDGTPVGRRGVLSILLSNQAALLVDAESYVEALRCAEGAVALDPVNAAGLSARAEATWQTDLDADPRPDLDRAAEIVPSEASLLVVSAEMAWKLGFAEDALRRADEAYRISPSPDAVAMKARAYLALGDTERAERVADAGAARWPGASGALAFVRFEMALDREGYAPLDRTDIPPLWKARALLDRASPARALKQLDAARESILEEQKTRFEGNTIYTVDQGARASRRREFRLLEARAFAKLGRAREAREALRAAEKAAPPDRETLEVRRLLAGE